MLYQIGQFYMYRQSKLQQRDDLFNFVNEYQQYYSQQSQQIMKSFAVVRSRASSNNQSKLTLQIKHLYDVQLKVPKLIQPKPEQLMQHIIDLKKPSHSDQQSHVVSGTKAKPLSAVQSDSNRVNLNIVDSAAQKAIIKQQTQYIDKRPSKLSSNSPQHSRKPVETDNNNRTHIVFVGQDIQENFGCCFQQNKNSTKQKQPRKSQLNHSPIRQIFRNTSRKKIFESSYKIQTPIKNQTKSLLQGSVEKIQNQSSSNLKVEISHESQQQIKQPQQVRFSKLNCRVMKPQVVKNQQAAFYGVQNSIRKKQASQSTTKRRSRSRKGKRIFNDFPNQVKSQGDISLMSRSSCNSYARSSASPNKKKIFQNAQKYYKKKYQNLRISAIPQQKAEYLITPRITQNQNQKRNGQTQTFQKNKCANNYVEKVQEQALNNEKTTKKVEMLGSPNYYQGKNIKLNARQQKQKGRDSNLSCKIIKLGHYRKKGEIKTDRKNFVERPISKLTQAQIANTNSNNNNLKNSEYYYREVRISTSRQMLETQLKNGNYIGQRKLIKIIQPNYTQPFLI